MRPALGLALGLALATSLAPTAGRASCGAESCPIDLHGSHAVAGRFSFDMNVQAIDQDRVLVGTQPGTVGQLPSPEDEVETRTRLTTLLGYAVLSDRLRVSAAMPWVERLHRHIRNDPAGPTPMEWHYSGLGDLLTMLHWTATGAGMEERASLTLQAGIKLPTGARSVEPVDGEQPEPPARPGTGSFDVLVGAHLMRAWRVRSAAGIEAAAPCFASVMLRANGRGTEDYRVGNEVQLSLGGRYPLAASAEVIGQINARIRGRDDVGATDALSDNTGGEWIYASPGLSVRTGPVGLYGYFQLPVYQRVNRIQIVAPYHLMVGLSVPPSR